MKKQLLLLTAGSMLVFASCQNEATPVDAGASQAQIDSIVNARVETIRAEMMAQNDSLINALAQWKADSIIAAMKGAKVAAPKPVVKKPGVKQAPVNAEVNKPAPETPNNPKDSRFGGAQPNTGQSKDSRFNPDAQKQQQQQNSGKKDDRFK